MMHLDRFIEQTGKHPPDWTSQDVEKYLDYLKAHVAEITASKELDN